jgi:hypothetical protein
MENQTKEGIGTGNPISTFLPEMSRESLVRILKIQIPGSGPDEPNKNQ